MLLITSWQVISNLLASHLVPFGTSLVASDNSTSIDWQHYKLLLIKLFVQI